MTDVGQIERATQNRLIQLFQTQLWYEYLGNWEKRENNRNVETDLLKACLTKQGIADRLISGAVREADRVAGDLSKNLYDRNRAFYDLIRYGAKIKPEAGTTTETVWLIDWQHPENNHFALAEEVTVTSPSGPGFTKRPDLVLYVNGIALGVIELKRSTVAVEQGIRQNLDNQSPKFIEHFFSTMQLVMAGNDTEGLRYGTIQTREKYFLNWREDSPSCMGEQQSARIATSPVTPLLDRQVIQLCSKKRLLEIVHDFVVFDAGTKKLCRQNQYFGVNAAHAFLRRREGGIIWHTQGSGKSLTMVFLAKWIRENMDDARLLLVTDRTELDDQIEKVFKGVNEEIYRSKSGADLIEKLNTTNPWLLCSLIHKFGGKTQNEDEDDTSSGRDFIKELRAALPPDFAPKGNLVVFVDECHRTQSGDLHDAMKAILPNAIFIGFTGTPLLKADKQKSIEVFGQYIHTYRFDEAVKDKVVLDLRYEARDIDQRISSPEKIDQWFEANTSGLTAIAKAQLRERWGKMQTLLSSRSRLEQIVADIQLDMETKDRLKSGYGNAMLVSSSIYQACKYYELFQSTPLKGKCAIITSYQPNPTDIKGEETGEGITERLHQYEIYKKMLDGKDTETFEKEAKKKFIDEPGQMKLLIVVDKLLTGFDAPSATYLYIDKQMRDHGLFQAICRVNRVAGEDKEYGYIVDYKDLFKSVESAIEDYTNGALSGYEKEDVAGLLKNRLQSAREDLELALEEVQLLCEPVENPKDTAAYLRYFVTVQSGNAAVMQANEGKRITLYKLTAKLIRTFANIANELKAAGYTPDQIKQLQAHVLHYTNVRDEVKLASGDAIDLKRYEPAMRHLIDTYIKADESQKISAFDDLSLVQLIIERGPEVIDDLPEGLRGNQTATAETIENNVRRTIVEQEAINPKYYEQMSLLLSELIQKRREEALSYKEYLAQIVELAKKVAKPGSGKTYPANIQTPGQKALYDNIGDLDKAMEVHEGILREAQHGFRENQIKKRKLRQWLATHFKDEAELEQMYRIIEANHEY